MTSAPLLPSVAVDEIFRETLRLRLGADENRDAKNDPAEAEEKRALPMARESGARCKAAAWSPSGRARQLRVHDPLPNELPGPQSILIGHDDVLAFLHARERLGEIQRAKTDLHRARLRSCRALTTST